MMATLGRDKEAALGGVTLLTHFLNTSAMTPDQLDAIKSLLSRMQGVVRLSSMLCPTFSKEEEDMLAPGKTHTLLYKLKVPNHWYCVIGSTHHVDSSFG